jgi:Fur family ferric uptake transcriptional regulator
MRQTRQRRLIWESVVALGGHCTADEIAARVQNLEPGMARSTVYRGLEALVRSGVVHAVRLGEGPIRYEPAGERHQHAVCQLCDGVLHLEDDLLRELEEHLEARHRFRPVRTEVLVMGVCDACARGARPRRARRTIEHVHFDELNSGGSAPA